MRRLLVALGAASLALGLALPAQARSNPRIFDSIPDQVPGNVVSQGFEATQTDQLGDQIKFAQGGRRIKRVTVAMSSWACESGTWSSGCVTTPGARFSEKVTFRIYAKNTIDPSLPGPLLRSKTRTFSMPYRPSADPARCGTGATTWYSTRDDHCYNGKAFKITFRFLHPKRRLPNEIVYGVAYNTSNSGNAPEGTGRACYGTPAGCPDDSLNVGLGAGLPKRGFDRYLDGVFIDSLQSDCVGASVPDTFSLDDGCWTGYNPLVRFIVRT